MERFGLLSVFLVSLIIFSGFAVAIGSSTEVDVRVGNSNSSGNNSVDVESETSVNCDVSNVRLDRIKCRLENREAIKARTQMRERYANYNDDSSTYEACQGLRNEGLCVALYAQSRRCYNLSSGTDRDECFKSVTEFKERQASVEVERAENKMEARLRVRHYMVLVLYNMQGKVEAANERGKISDEDAAELIDKIVEIKRLTLEGEGKAEIRTEIAELKVMWRAALGNVNNSGDEQE